MGTYDEVIPTMGAYDEGTNDEVIHTQKTNWHYQDKARHHQNESLCGITHNTMMGEPFPMMSLPVVNTKSSGSSSPRRTCVRGLVHSKKGLGMA